MAKTEIASNEEIVSMTLFDNSAIAKECCDKLAAKIVETLRELGRLATKDDAQLHGIIVGGDSAILQVRVDGLGTVNAKRSIAGVVSLSDHVLVARVGDEYHVTAVGSGFFAGASPPQGFGAYKADVASQANMPDANMIDVLSLPRTDAPRPTEPTEVGKRNFPPSGFYDGEPCTCTDECDEDCDGACGCDACWALYADGLEALDYD